MKLFLQLCKGVAHMHAMRVVHNDIKPSNVFLKVKTRQDGSVEMVAKLGDFGMASFGESCYIGTEEYMAPEVFARGVEADVWSMGVVLYQLTHFGRIPTFDHHRHLIVNDACQKTFPGIKGILVSMLHFDKSKRLDMDHVTSAIKRILD